MNEDYHDEYFGASHIKFKCQKIWRRILGKKMICRQCDNTDPTKMRFFWDDKQNVVAIGCRRCAHGSDYDPSEDEFENFSKALKAYMLECHSNWREQNKDKMPPEILDEMSSNYALDA